MIKDVDNSSVTEESLRKKVPQLVDIAVSQPVCPVYMVDVPICDDLVDLSPCETTSNWVPSTSTSVCKDLEGLVFPSYPHDEHTDKFTLEGTTCAISVHFEKQNNCPFISGKISDHSVSFLCDTGAAITTISSAFFRRLPNLTKHPPSSLMMQSIRTVSGESVPISGLALIPFQIGECQYPYQAYIVDNLAYDAILGADFLTHHQSVINFDTSTLQLPPQTDTPPPPPPDFSCSVHAVRTCVLPPFSESIIPADLNDFAPVVATCSLVGLVEGSPRLIECYNLCGAAALVQVSENNTIPFRVINPTFQPVTIYRRTNLGQFSIYNTLSRPRRLATQTSTRSNELD